MKENMVEVAVYGVLTGIWWISSTTFLLPFFILLKYSKYFRDRWFSFIFISVLGPTIGPKMRPGRQKAFELLKKNLRQKTTDPLKILEIGVGSGSNLEFYPERSHLTALDMNDSFEKYYNKNREKYPNIVYDRTVISVAEDMKDIDDSSMDLVISTYVLCSVTSIDDCMREIKRVLKPGGKFLFLEHVGYPKSDWSFSVQNMADPLWKIYFNGCCLTRDIGDHIKNSGFRDVICEKVFPKMWFFVRPQVYGLATK